MRSSHPRHSLARSITMMLRNSKAKPESCEKRNDPLSISLWTGLLLTSIFSGLAGCSPHRPLDVVSTAFDVNGFPMNPRWQAQVDNNVPMSLADVTTCNPTGSNQD